MCCQARVIKQKGADFPLQSKHWNLQSEGSMKYFLKTACILLLLISFTHSTYSQTWSLERLNNQKAGLELAYNQTSFEKMNRGVDGTDHNTHFVIPVWLSDSSKLSVMPCFIYRDTEAGGTIGADLNAGCYLRYTVIYNTTIPKSFYRLGIGGNTYTLDGTESRPWIWKLHGGGGTFWDLNKSTGVPLKLSSGLFIQGEIERQIEKSMNNNDGELNISPGWGFDISAELGVELNILEKQSLSVTCITYLYNTYGVSNFYPTFYFSVRLL